MNVSVTGQVVFFSQGCKELMATTGYRVDAIGGLP